MVDAVADGTGGLEIEGEREVVVERAGMAAAGALPEGRLDDAADAGVIHGGVVVGGAREHVDVGFDDGHGMAPE